MLIASSARALKGEGFLNNTPLLLEPVSGGAASPFARGCVALAFLLSPDNIGLLTAGVCPGVPGMLLPVRLSAFCLSKLANN